MDTRFEKVRNTQIALFKKSGLTYHATDELIELFSPNNLADYLGLNYIELEEIPSEDPLVRTAGILDRNNKSIYVSRQFPIEQRRLTGLHEIIHWMLHDHVGRDVLHRDRPITHTPNRKSVEYHEWEATHYACRYLMPEKLVREIFASTFNLKFGETLELDEQTAFFLNKDIEEVRLMDRNAKHLLIATTPIYIRHITPLHEWFKVSPTAMAIRLKELNLISPDRKRGKPDLFVV